MSLASLYLANWSFPGNACKAGQILVRQSSLLISEYIGVGYFISDDYLATETFPPKFDLVSFKITDRAYCLCVTQPQACFLFSCSWKVL